MYTPIVNDLMNEYMGQGVTKLLKSCGEGVKVYPMAKIVSPNCVKIGDNTRLCDFSFIHPEGGTIEIGRYCDFEPYSLIWGAGKMKIGDFVNFGPGMKIMGNLYDYKIGDIMVGTVEQTHAGIIAPELVIEDHVYFGADVTVLGSVHYIGEGALIGAQTLVNRDLEPWGVYVGSPAKKIGERPRGALDKVTMYGLGNKDMETE